MGMVRKSAGKNPRKKRQVDCTRKIVTETTLKSLAPGRTASDSLPGQGSGAILFEAREARIDAYFRTRANGKSQKVKIGVFKKSEKHDGLTLEEIRKEARNFSDIALEYGDVKRYLKEKKVSETHQRQAHEKAAQEEERRLKEASACGTLSDLFYDYILNIQESRSKDYVKEIQRCFDKHVKNDFPEISEMKANEIKPQHIYAMLQPVWQSGSQGMSDRLRTYFHAVFNFGIKNDYSQEKKRDIFYHLESNPVSHIPRDYKSKAITTSLNPEELHHFWHSMQHFDNVGPVIRNFLLFIIATGGQRIIQLLREPWSSYDLDARLLHTTHKKGRNDPRIHLVPLTDRAIALLEEARSINPFASHPWTSSGKTTLNINSLGDAIESWLSKEHSMLNGKPFKKFTPRDLRRTCKQLMQALDIPQTDSNTLQSHDTSGVSTKHYNNNPYAYITTLKKTIERFDQGLEQVINGDFSELDYFKYERKSV